MPFRSSDLLPCSAFFSEGRVMAGIVALLMQMSLIFWPRAIEWARNTQDNSGVDRLLAELADTHRAPTDPYAKPAKRFRHAA